MIEYLPWRLVIYKNYVLVWKTQVWNIKPIPGISLYYSYVPLTVSYGFIIFEAIHIIVYSYATLKGEFAVVPTDKIEGGAYHQKFPLIWTAYLWNCMWQDQRDQGHIPQKFPVIFVGFRLMKNIIFNKTKRFLGRNTSDHACQIFCFKSNCETMYHWFFLLEITVVKIMNNLNVCSAHSYLYTRSRFKSWNLTMEWGKIS